MTEMKFALLLATIVLPFQPLAIAQGAAGLVETNLPDRDGPRSPFYQAVATSPAPMLRGKGIDRGFIPFHRNDLEVLHPRGKPGVCDGVDDFHVEATPGESEPFTLAVVDGVTQWATDRHALVGVFVTLAAILCSSAFAAEMLRDHEVVLDEHGRLMPWTTYDNVLKWSMKFIKECPTERTKFGDDPWYLITSKLNEDGSFRRNQNQQGSNAYWAVATLTKYYAYTGDEEAIKSVKLLLDRILRFHTPADWPWPAIPRTQDDSPDGQYTDETSESDKICMVGIAYINFYKLCGDKRYLNAALEIAETIVRHVKDGDATQSPLPFRVNLKSGEVLDHYTANMIYAVMFLDESANLDPANKATYHLKRKAIWKWILKYPISNNRWSGLYEDVESNLIDNMNQQTPMETARYILQHPAIDPEYKEHIPALIKWVRDRFGMTKRYGATSIKEQDRCFVEMSSHTARYASVVSKWFGVTLDPKDREEARASFALATYSAYSRHSKNEVGINYVGVGYTHPWFSDSYFDYLPHILDGMAELPEMTPEAANHIIGSDSIVKKVTYSSNRVEYETFESSGKDILRICFAPHRILADGKALAQASWTYGMHRDVSGVLRIERTGTTHILVEGRFSRSTLSL